MGLTEEDREKINPEYCAEVLLNMGARLTFSMTFEEKAAVFGAISLILNKPAEEWIFGEKTR